MGFILTHPPEDYINNNNNNNTNINHNNNNNKNNNVKALVRWATGKRLTNRLPKLSLLTLSPLLNRGILGLRIGPYVPTPKFFIISGDPGRVIYQILHKWRRGQDHGSLVVSSNLTSTMKTLFKEK